MSISKEQIEAILRTAECVTCAESLRMDIRTLGAALAERDAEIHRLTLALSEGDGRHRELREQMAERNAEIERLKQDAQHCSYWHNKTLVLDMQIIELRGNAARDASAREAMLAEMRGLRERLAPFQINGHQIKHLMDLVYGEDETEICLEWFKEERPDGNSAEGEIMPPGLYAWFAEYPEEGQLHLPERARVKP